MDAVLFFGVDAYLSDSENSGEKGVVSKENIVEVYFAGLGVIYEVAVGIIDPIKEEASQVHGYEVEVHAFHAM